MIARSMLRTRAALVLAALAWAGMPTVYAADEKPATKETKPGTTEKAEAKGKKSPADYRGPLPAYYNKVLSPDEKEKLYAITEKYAEKMKPLVAQIRALEAERQKELDAALTPEQLTRIKELRDEAKGKAVKKPAAEGEAKPKTEAGK